ncbi:MAG: 50S ribosomal protein L6, partial [archaeon]
MAEKTIEKVTIPGGITPSYASGTLSLSKSGKTATKKLAAPEVTITVKEQIVTITPINLRRFTIATMRSIAAHVRNMILGIEKGFTYKLAVVHAHFPMAIKVVGKRIEVPTFLGEKNPRYANIVGDSKV